MQRLLWRTHDHSVGWNTHCHLDMLDSRWTPDPRSTCLAFDSRWIVALYSGSSWPNAAHFVLPGHLNGDTPTAPNTLPAKEMEGVLEFRTCSKLLEDHGFCPHLDLSGRSSAECCCELSHILSGPDSRSPSPPEGIGCTRSPAVMDWDGHPRASLAVGWRVPSGSFTITIFGRSWKNCIRSMDQKYGFP